MSLVFTILVGIITGFSAGMFGIGGALLSTPLLHQLVHLDPLIALATPLPATLPAAISGSVVYFRERLLRLDVAGYVLLGGIPLNVLGARAVKSVPGSVMMIATGLVLLYSAGLFITRSVKRYRSARHTRINPEGGPKDAKLDEREGKPLQLIVIGGLAGLFAGFLAIGGGMVMVPAFVSFLRMPTKQALATSLFCVAALSVPGIVTHHLNGFIDWNVALVLCLAVLPFSAIGARVTTKVKTSNIELLYGLGMMIFALYFIAKNL